MDIYPYNICNIMIYNKCDNNVTINIYKNITNSSYIIPIYAGLLHNNLLCDISDISSNISTIVLYDNGNNWVNPKLYQFDDKSYYINI